MGRSSNLTLGGAFAAALMLSGCASAQPQRAYAPRIERDAYGVPTIRGASDADVAYGVAIAFAEDNFADLQRQVLMGRGRLASVFGPAGAGSDFMFHVLGVEQAVAARYRRDLSPGARALVEAYAAGVNAYGAAHPDEMLPGAENVRGEDVIAGFVHNSPVFWGFDNWLSRVTADNAHPCAAPALPPLMEDRGSNAFAVAPSRSADGHTRLIVNSHQPWTGPVAWYELRIESETGWRFHGGTFAGSPVPFVGTNGALGYAATVNYPDLADYYRLVTDDAHPNQYFFDGQWRAFETRDFTIAVKTDAGVVQQPRSLRFSVHGPVFETADGVIALRAAGVGDVRGVEQYYRMSRARDFAAWKRALAMQAVPSTNIVYADREGHIALIYNARFPDRAADARYDWQGCLPGDDPAALWTRYLPADAAPRLIDPASGWVYSANASPFSASDADADMAPAAFPASMGIERWMTNRARRAVEQLAPQEKISDESLLAAKFDITYSEHSVVGETITMLTGLEVGNDAELRAAQDLLRGWDRRASADSRVMALAYAAITPFAQARFGRRAPPEDALAALRAAAAQTKASFGRLDPLWGDVLRLRRGAVDLPLEGGPDLLRAVTFGAASDGKLVGVHGDGLIIVVDWAPDGSVRTRTISQFGAAAERPRSPHYNDQAALFAQYKFRYDVTEPSR